MAILGATWMDVLIVLAWALATLFAKSLGPAFLLSYAAVWVFIAVFFGYIREPFASVLHGGNLVVSYLVLWITLSLPIYIIGRFGRKLLEKVLTSLGRRIDFVLEAIYYRPDGSILGRTILNNHVEAPWTRSRHWHAFGWSEPGKWSVGQYRLDVCEGENLVAAGSFAIVNDPDSVATANANSSPVPAPAATPNPTGHVMSINGRVDQLSFFEKGDVRIPQSEREYCTTFSKEATRRVAWELRLQYSPPYRRAYHLIGWGVGALVSFLSLSVIMSALAWTDKWAISQKIEESRLAALMAGLSDVIAGGFVAITRGDF